MKKAKLLALVLAGVLALTSLTACSDNSKKVKVGVLALTSEEISATVDELNANGVNVEDMTPSDGLIREWSYFPSYTELILALNTGKVDAISCAGVVGYYLTRGDSTLKMIKRSTISSFQMALLPEKTELRDKLSAAIDELLADKTLDGFFSTYINNSSPDKLVDVEEVKKIEGAETVKVAITGDLPPMDYVSADGKPAGFNVALINAISEKIGMNVELVQVSAEARVSALSSGKADAVFWYQGSGAEGSKDNDKLIFTSVYYQSNKTVIARAESYDNVLKVFPLKGDIKDVSYDEDRTTALIK